jgi:putative phosphoesterase
VTRILLLADTHVPNRARGLPDQVWRAVDAADVVIHAGDWVDVATLDALEHRAERLIGVWGNNDPAPLRERLPGLAHETIGGVGFTIVHETGPAAGREARCDAAYRSSAAQATDDGPTRVLVFGHSHIPWDSTTPGGLRLLNPGSATDRRRQPTCTMMVVEADAGRLSGVQLVSVSRSDLAPHDPRRQPQS